MTLQRRALVTGSRDFPELDLVDAFVDRLDADVTLVVGDARGVDARARARAEARGLAVEPHPVTDEEWALYGKRAGPMRNRRMVESLHRGDRVQAFWDGRSRGTAGTVEMARARRDIAVEVTVRRAPTT